ncbi:MAG TPA: co-chaperone GroES family protein [Syntrophales bacterium]|nr:co-chaperone GroES family protein [Syntrophales bacterium]
MGELMAISLFNSYIAMDGIEAFSGNERVMQGVVRLVGAGVTGIVALDRIFYPKESGRNVMYQGKEYIIVKQADVIGKL